MAQLDVRSGERHLDALIVEDLEGDARLIVTALRQGGFTVDFERVESRSQMDRALDRHHWDLVISDCNLPTFSALRALELLHERKLEIPVIVVSGIMHEDAALQIFHAGAHDFLSKNSLARLVPVVERELEGAARREKELALNRELERRVRLSEGRFRNLFELAPVGVLLITADGRISELNRRARAMFEYTSAELIGRPIATILPTFQPDELRRTSQESVTGAPPIEGSEGRRRGGQTFPVEVTLDAMSDASDHGTIVGVRDVTERQRNREELQIALAEASAIRDQLDSVLDCAPAFIVALDTNGAIKFINRVAPGRRREDLIGADWVSFVPETDREQARRHLQGVLRTGIPAAFELHVTEADGQSAWYTCFMGPLRSGEQVHGAVIIAQEVTADRRVREELAAAQRLAAVGTLAAGIAHEINTPMQFVNDSLHFLREASREVMTLVCQLKSVHARSQLGASEVEMAALAREVETAENAADLPYLTEQMPKAFDRCIDGLERMTDIVRSLKEFAHPATREARPADLNRAIQSTLIISRNEYKYIADLETDFGELPPVVCHVNDINQVVLNLVINAAHAIAERCEGTETKGTIRVCSRHAGDWIVISVSDTGGGIPEAVRSRIFEPFFTTKEVGKGTGQGLAIAWSIITEKHRGQLTFETELGQGTTFFIRLPFGSSLSQPLELAARPTP